MSEIPDGLRKGFANMIEALLERRIDDACAWAEWTRLSYPKTDLQRGLQEIEPPLQR